MSPATHRIFARADWAKLRANVPLTLSEADLVHLRGINETVSLQEVEEVYLPITRLLNLHIAAARSLTRVADDFLGQPPAPQPYVIAIAGSVAVGKSSFARILQALLSRWPDHPRVDLVTTDGFLYPTRVLEERGLMGRKGFPESYDLRRMIEFLSDVKAGRKASAPVYSHQSYDIVPDEFHEVRRPDILIFEGLNVLQLPPPGASTVASDFFDFSIYIDADEADIERWYVERFLTLQQTAFRQPSSYFHHLHDVAPEEARRVAIELWTRINRVNLEENIAPTRARAGLVIRKASDHSTAQLWLRR